MGHIIFPETPVRNYQYMLRNSLGKRSSKYGKHVDAVKLPKIKPTASDQNVCETFERAVGRDLVDY